MRSRRALVVCCVCAAVILLLFAPISRQAESKSPDGRFVLVVRTQPIYALIPAMPGQGRDTPARATLYKRDNSCGSVWLPMASFVDDLQWRLESSPREAEIRFAGRWNLDDCSLEQE